MSHRPDYALFHEYYDGDTGRGLGATHQGWTTLAADLLQQPGADDVSPAPAESASAELVPSAGRVSTKQSLPKGRT